MTAAVDDPKQLGKTVERWDAELRAYEKATEKWRKDVKRIERRYALEDRQAERDDTARFNILWSNVQTQTPALFSRAPVPVVERRHRDRDPVARLASSMLERAVTTDLEFDEIEVVMSQVSLDFQLAGRGLPWVRYDADIRSLDVPVFTDDSGQVMDGDGNLIDDEPEDRDGQLVVTREEIAWERAPVDFVYWQDFYHKPVKSWRDLENGGWVARRVTMTKAAIVERFGRQFETVPLKVNPDGMEDKEAAKHDVVKRAEVFEIWDAASRKVIWINRDFKDRPLDERDDPLELESFFPCPRAAYSTLKNSSLIPVPDYLQYEDLADQLDDVTERISVLTKAIKVRGIYDAAMEKLGALLNDDGGDNTMLPVENMAAYLAKGATGSQLQNVVQFLPIDIIAKVLLLLYDARDRIKDTLFEVSGLSDILRGQVDPREKLGQSRIKGQFATLRLDTRQREMARMARDTLRIKAEIIAEKFSPDILRQISGFDQLGEVEEMRRKEQENQMPEGTLVEPAFQQAAQLIRDDKTRGFRIDIETDSTVQLDEQAEKEARVELLAGIGNYLQTVTPIAIQQPKLAPMFAELMLFAMRAFKAGRNVESLVEEVVDQLRRAAEQPQEPQPDPEMLKVQAETEQAQARLQLDRETKGQELALKRETSGQELRLKEQQIAGELALKARIERLKLGAENGVPAVDAQDVLEEMAQIVRAAVAGMQSAAQQMAADKVVVRDQSGRVVGTRTVNGA